MQTSAGRCVQSLPDEGNGHTILALSIERPAGYLLLDDKSFWNYDDSTLSLEEQDVAGQIPGLG